MSVEATEIVPLRRPLARGIDLDVPGAGRLIESFLQGLGPHTQRAYEGDIRAFGRWLGVDGALAVDGLLQLDGGRANELVLKYRNAMVERGLAPATIARRLAAIRSMMTLGRTLGYTSVTIEIDDPKVEKYRDTRGPGEDGFRSMLDVARSAVQSAELDHRTHPHQPIRDLALLRLLRALMLRRSSATRMDLADLELDEEPPGVWVWRKGHSQRKRFTLPPRVVESLRAWIAVRGDWPGPLFVRLDRAAGDPPGRLSGQAVYDLIRGLGGRAGIRRRVTPHQLRHEGITTALARTDGNVIEVMDLSGHADPKTLMLYNDRLRDSAGKVARLLDED